MKFNTKNNSYLRLPEIYLLVLSILLMGSACSSSSKSEIDKGDIYAIEVETSIGQPIIETTSLNGEGLVRPDFDPETSERLTANLREAIENFNENPDDPESIIWVARHTAYLWRYQDAIYILTDGMNDYPNDARFYRHRGHRYITVREFDKAIDDLKKAAELIKGKEDEIEPDGAPNAANIPVSTLHFNIYYHLGLAYYLQNNYSQAAEQFKNALNVARNSDTRVSAFDWLYISMRKSGRVDDAATLLQDFDTNIDVIESQSYLSRIKVYKGELAPEALMSAENDLNILTQGYGLAQFYLFQGDSAKSTELLEKVLDTNYWAAFGYIAAEADLYRNMNQD